MWLWKLAQIPKRIESPANILDAQPINARQLSGRAHDNSTTAVIWVSQLLEIELQNGGHKEMDCSGGQKAVSRLLQGEGSHYRYVAG